MGYPETRHGGAWIAHGDPTHKHRVDGILLGTNDFEVTVSSVTRMAMPLP